MQDIKALILVITLHLLILSTGRDSNYTHSIVNNCEISYLFKSYSFMGVFVLAPALQQGAQT